MNDVTLHQARLIATAVLSKAREIGVPMSIAVLDSAGAPVLQYRMDGATLISLRCSHDKAYAAAMTGRATAELQAESTQGGPLHTLQWNRDGVMCLTGGLPLRDRAGCLVGALGTSGGALAEDLAC